MSEYDEYVVAFFDEEGKFLGYYAEESDSGGYPFPYIADSIRQAVTMTEDWALKTAEESFKFPYNPFNLVHSCVTGKLEIPNGTVIRRDTYEEQCRQREIKQRLEEIVRLQEEIRALEGAKDAQN